MRGGGRLVEIWNHATQKGLEDLIKSYGHMDYWIGAKKKLGKFRWRSRPRMEPTYWPSNIEMTPRAYCMTINSTGNWRYNECEKPRSYICQAKILGDVPQKPEVTMEIHRQPETVFVGSPFKARCYAEVGPEWTVSWIYYYGPGGRTPLPLGSSGIQHKEVFQKRSGLCKRVIISSFISPVIEQPWDRIRNVFSCKVHPVGAPETKCRRNRALCGFDQGVIVSYSNLQPNLKVDYHGEGEVVHLGRTAVFHCDAIVGPLGNVSWVINRHHPDQNITIDPHDPRAMYFNLRSFERVFGTSPNRKEMTAGSKLRLLVTDRIQGATVSCYSFVLLPNSAQRLNSLYTESPPLQVKYGPQTPILRVKYHEFHDRVIIGWNLTAMCSACVGDEGTITWTFLDSHDQTLAKEDLDSLNMVEQSSRVENITGCGTKVTSKVKVEVTPVLNGVHLACFSYNETYLPGVRVHAYSWPLVTQDSIKGTPIPKSYLIEAFPALLSLLVFILLLVALRRWLKKRRRGQQPDTSDTTPSRRPHHPHHDQQHKHHHYHHHHHHHPMLKIYNPASGTSVDSPSWKLRKPRTSQELAAVAKVQQKLQRRKLRQHPGRARHPAQKRRDPKRAAWGGARDKRGVPVAGRDQDGQRESTSSTFDQPQYEYRGSTERRDGSGASPDQSPGRQSASRRAWNVARGATTQQRPSMWQSLFGNISENIEESTDSGSGGDLEEGDDDDVRPSI